LTKTSDDLVLIDLLIKIYRSKFVIHEKEM